MFTKTFRFSNSAYILCTSRQGLLLLQDTFSRDLLFYRACSPQFAARSRHYFKSSFNNTGPNDAPNSKSKYLPILAAGCLLSMVGVFKRFGLSNDVKAIEKVDESNSPRFVNNPKSWNFIADVVEKVAPAVVYIEISGKHPFTGRTVAVSNGSGFIVRADGLVITNAHVVGNSAKVKVRLNDGTQKVGVVQAVDAVSDLATIKISGDNLPTMKLGKSHLLRTGEWVVAMGSPLQLSNTVTAGIVSSANRKSQDLGLHNKDISYIQTDANINFGNSGGPLVNLNGEAIGINTMMVTSGISFAIPSDYASEFLAKAAQLEERSKIKGWYGSRSVRSPDVPEQRHIGITMVTLNPDLLLNLRVQHRDLMKVEHGVLIYRVILGSPADEGGIQPGDIITEMNGQQIKSSDDVYKALDSTCEKIDVTVIRGHSVLKLTVTPDIIE